MLRACLQYCSERRYVTLFVSTITLILVALKAILAESKENRYKYDFKLGKALNPDSSIPTRSAFTKCRAISLLFRNRRLPRLELKKQCRAKEISYRRTAFDMLVR